jgi:hypothetical protein
MKNCYRYKGESTMESNIIMEELLVGWLLVAIDCLSLMLYYLLGRWFTRPIYISSAELNNYQSVLRSAYVAP